MIKKKSQSKDETTLESEIIEQRLSELRVIQQPQVQLIFAWMPIALVLLIMIDWLIGAGSFSRDIFRLSSTITVAIILLITNLLFNKLPDTLRTIWLRDLIEIKSSKSDLNSFLKFLDQFQQSLNGKWALIIELLGAIGGLLSTYPFRYFFLAGGRFPFDISGMLLFYFGSHGSFIAPVLGYILGFIVWRVSVIAYYVSEIGSRFALKVQPNHPDNCGGFKPLGDLVLLIAILILIPSIVLGFWGSTNNVLWGDVFRFLLVFLGILSLIVFIQPLYSIHLQMKKAARKIQSELDVLTRKIEALSFELRTQAYMLTPEDGEQKLQTIEFIKKIHQSNSRVPIWPFDWKTIASFTGAQILPLLSILNINGTTIINFFKNLLP